MRALVLPVPPSGNVYWRHYRGRMVRSREAERYIQLVGLIGLQHRVRPTHGDVFLTVRWYRGKRVGDLDNRLKIVLDALQGIVYHDDGQVVRLFAERIDGDDAERMEVEWAEVEAA